jgi:hypothetical protein
VLERAGVNVSRARHTGAAYDQRFPAARGRQTLRGYRHLRRTASTQPLRALIPR